MSKGSVYLLLLEKSKSKKLCLPLIDPVNFMDLSKLDTTISSLDVRFIDAFLVGGSTLAAQEDIDRVIEFIKGKIDRPLIIFPNNVGSISKKADAILFMMLMNSSLTYYLVEAQVLASPLIERYRLETIPTGYVVINADSAVSFIGHARPIPPIPELVSLYVIAAKHYGFKVVYLEGGSGTSSPITPEIVKESKKWFPGLLFVGGGITSAERAQELALAGADGLIIGNLIEKKNGPERFNEICKELAKIKSQDI